MATISEIVGHHNLYVTRTWGFTPHKWGVVSFPNEGSVDSWIEKMEDHIFVLCFASHRTNEYISKENKGRVFGIYEAVPEKMYYTDEGAIEEGSFKYPLARSLNEKGEFRWPWGLKAIRAWKFTKHNILTRETLPDSRTLGFEIASNISPISKRDYQLINQPSYQLEEVQVYMRPKPQILTTPNARPDLNYLFICENEKTLERIPQWKKGEVLIKPGISSNIDNRLDTINNHPISNIFQIQFQEIWRGRNVVSEELARKIEKKMIEEAQRVGRLAAKGQKEYFFIPKGHWSDLIAVAEGITRVS